MSLKSGYFKKHLHIDLTKGSAERRDLPDSFIEKYIGGRGFGAKLVWDNLRKHDFKIDPLGPENLMVVAPGPLTGVYLPSSGKNSFVAISPATGLYGDSSIGGSFGVELRQTGLDVLSITGRAPELSIIFIDNDETAVIPMPELKGKSCLEAEGRIEERLGTHAVHVAIIGVAGENMVRFACVNTDWGRNAGRTGIGAIMGSKNLKAIVVRGHKDIPVYDVPGLVLETEKAFRYLQEHKYFKMWQQEGLMNVIEYANEKGILPAYNFKDSVFTRHDRINGATMLDQYKIGDSACFSCPMCCSNICLVKNGKYTGTVVEGPEYESCAMLGPNLGIDNFAAIVSYFDRAKRSSNGFHLDVSLLTMSFNPEGPNRSKGMNIHIMPSIVNVCPLRRQRSFSIVPRVRPLASSWMSSIANLIPFIFCCLTSFSDIVLIFMG